MILQTPIKTLHTILVGIWDFFKFFAKCIVTVVLVFLTAIATVIVGALLVMLVIYEFLATLIRIKVLRECPTTARFWVSVTATGLSTPTPLIRIGY